jgi:hypothetical protein
MPSFLETVDSMPGLKDLSAAGRAGLSERVVAEILGYHRWPFLLQAQQEFTWAASTAIQDLPGVFRIWSIMYPNSQGDYYRLEEKSDIEFQEFIEFNPDEAETRIWRDAGTVGTKQKVELYKVPTSAKTLKIDYTTYPDSGDIDQLPFRFQNLVIKGMMSALGTYSKTAYMVDLQAAIAREKDLQGKRSHVGKDQIQAARFSNINSPS